jgi:Ca-activated chloride channel family protein
MLAFSGVTYTVCPPTLDHGFLKDHIGRLEAGLLEDGTGIAAPISSAVAALQDSDAKRTVAVLFTDGANNVNIRLSPPDAARVAKELGVIVHTVGIGGRRSLYAQRYVGGRQRYHLVKGHGYDGDLLAEIAAVSGGRYFEARDADGLRSVLAEIDALETVELEQPRYVEYSERYHYWLLAGLLLIVLGFLCETTVCLRVP